MIKNINKYKCKICPYCNRRVPNKDFFTKYGCRWCDMDYYKKRLR